MKTNLIAKASTVLGLVAVASLGVAVPANAAVSTIDSVGTCTTTKTFTQNPGGFKWAAPTTSSGSVDCRLNQGNQGAAVSELQRMLRSAACNFGATTTLGVDGQFGPATASALKKFQSANGLTADGIYGTQTVRKISSQSSNSTWCIVVKSAL